MTGSTFEFSRIEASNVAVRDRHSPTVNVELVSGVTGSASIPSRMIRDPATRLVTSDESRVNKALNAVNNEISERLIGRAFSSLDEVDQAMCELDGTPDKSRLGPEGIIAVSKATARALALEARQPLFVWLPKIAEHRRLPMPCFNVMSGGAATATNQALRGFLVCPEGAPSLRDAVHVGISVYAALGERLKAKGYRTEVGDECGYMPEMADPAHVCDLITAAITDAGFELGSNGVSIGLNAAATNFRNDDGTYAINDQRLSAEELIELYADLVDRYPIHGIEDGVGDVDLDGWRTLTDRLSDRILLVGDDHFSTSVDEISKAVASGVANTALIKLNQIGSVSETAEAMRICQAAGYRQIVAYRFGETPDTFIADFTVASGCGLARVGAPVDGHGTGKYNRLREIADQWKGPKRLFSKRAPLAYGQGG